jgi:hypothetical protein
VLGNACLFHARELGVSPHTTGSWRSHQQSQHERCFRRERDVNTTGVLLPLMRTTENNDYLVMLAGL